MSRLSELQADAEAHGFVVDSYQGRYKIGLASENKGGHSYFAIRECFRGDVKEAEAFIAGANYGMGVARTTAEYGEMERFAKAYRDMDVLAQATTLNVVGKMLHDAGAPVPAGMVRDVELKLRGLTSAEEAQKAKS